MKTDKASVGTIIIIILVIIGAAYYVWFSNSAKERQLDNLPADNFNKTLGTVTLTDLDDNPVSLSDFNGSVLAVNTWASWCPFCTQELPDFQTLASEYKDKNVIVIAVNRAESKPQIQAYLNTLPNMSDLQILQDKTDSYYKFIGGFSMPETIFYNTEGNVVTHKRGFMKLDEMRTLVEQAIADKTE